MKVIELDQSTVEWLEWRHEGIGASDAPVIMGFSNYISRGELLHKKKAQLARGKENSNTLWGKKMEPIIRDRYVSLTGVAMRPVCVVHDTFPWLRASLDGLDPSATVALEIKAPNQDYHDQALAGQVPAFYWPQIQHQFAVSMNGEGVPQLTRIDYLSYNQARRFSQSDRFVRVKVLPDLGYIKELLEAEEAFRQEMDDLPLSEIYS